MKKLRLTLILATAPLMLMAQPNKESILEVMKRATHYMMDSLSCRGGFVWNYLPDHSRRWGEMEAYPTMIWMQSPSTPEVGHLLLDAYHTTGDEYYYEQACKVAGALIAAQKPCGGWNYMHDFAGEKSAQKWYSTIGSQAWRLEEFQHYYGNATFDDEATANSAEFMLRIYMEKKDQVFGKSLDKAIKFVVKSQYKNGGWPQRYPIKTNHPFEGRADYTPFITLNDDVAMSNLDFLMNCYHVLGRTDLEKPIMNAMYLLRDLQYGEPFSGWSDQYTQDNLLPAHARSYEPRSVNTATTVQMIYRMGRFYAMTGDKSFLRGIEKAYRFVASQQLPDSVVRLWRGTPRSGEEILVPRFIHPDNGLPLYVHRKGSNVKNGRYYTDQDIRGTIGHYSSASFINIKQLRAFCDTIDKLKVVSWKTPRQLDNYHYNVNVPQRRGRGMSVQRIIESLTPQGYWLVPIGAMSNPYKPIPESMPSESESREFTSTMVGDEYDTSPYSDRQTKAITTQGYIQNMCALMRALRGNPNLTLSGLLKERFEDKIDGMPVGLYQLRNRQGAEVCVTNYGARVVSLTVPDREGGMTDVVLGFDNIKSYSTLKQNFGATVGRYLGRITGAHYSLDGEEVQLQGYGTKDISHGGNPGFASRVWKVVDAEPQKLVLQYLSPDGENGFPGNLKLTLAMTLTDDNALRLDYNAVTDKATVLNPSNHSFFNISGEPWKDVLKEQMWINGDSIAEYSPKKQVTGRLIPVENTPFDFRDMHQIGNHIDDENDQLKVTNGYDHAWRLNTRGNIALPAARLADATSGIVLTVYTTEPALHVYTANGLNGKVVGKLGRAYPRRSAVCFETCHFADSPNQPQFPSTVLRPGEKFCSTTIFHFSTIH